MGNWAKGLTAASDPRVARNAAARLGRQRGPHRVGCGRRTLPLIWTPELAYAVGLIATDGCLWNTGRHISFDSNDRVLVESFLRCVGRSDPVRVLPTRIGNVRYRAAFGDVAMYRWLESIGLHPRKSLTLGGVDVPEEHFLPLVRGLLDGDGSVYTLVHAPTPSTYPNYRYERLWVLFTSASKAHIEWLRVRLNASLQISGYVHGTPPRRAAKPVSSRSRPSCSVAFRRSPVRT